MKSYLNFCGRSSCLLLSLSLVVLIKANEVVPNDLTASNQQQASASLANFNWLPGGGPTQYASAANGDLDTAPSIFGGGSEDDALLGEGSYTNRRKSYRRKGSKKRVKGRKRNKNKNKHRQPEYEAYSTGFSDEYDTPYDTEDEYYDRDDRDDGYGAPQAPAYSAPSYSAPSYEAPSDSYGAPSYSGGGGDGFNDFLNALAAFLPIGLFLAAIPPNLITISTRKKRSLTNSSGEAYSLNDVDTTHSVSLLERITEIGFYKTMSDVECQKRLFCEMTSKSKGRNEDATDMAEMMNYFVLLTPKSFSDYFGATEVFRSIKEGNCSKFKC